MLDQDSLNTTLVITNDGDVPFEFQTLLHTYFKIDVSQLVFDYKIKTNFSQDISSAEVTGLEDSTYINKLADLKEDTQSGAITFAAETDSVYTPVNGPRHPVVISESGTPRFRIVRDNLDQVVVWNPWVEKSAGIKDFEPKDGWKKMLCVEPGTVNGWQKLEKGDAFEASQTITLV